jgi:hypothetical protein
MHLRIREDIRQSWLHSGTDMTPLFKAQRIQLYSFVLTPL